MFKNVRLPFIFVSVVVAWSANQFSVSTAQAQQPAVTGVIARDVAFSQMKKFYDSLTGPARALVDRAIRLTDALDDMPCGSINAKKIYEEAEKTLGELKLLTRAAGVFGADTAEALFDYVGDDLDDALDWYLEDCGPPSGLGIGPLVSLGLSGGPSRVGLPSQAYLGINNGVTDILNLYKTPKYTTGESFSGYIKFDTTLYISPVFDLGGRGVTSTSLKFTGFYSSATLDDSPGTISPGAGNRMLFPGAQGGASGVSIGGFPANIVTNGMYSADFSKFGGRLDIGQSTKLQNGTTVELFGATGFGKTNYDQTFSGQVPGFNRVFSYDTDTKVDWIKLRFGIGVSRDFDIGAGTMLNLGATFEAGPDFSSGSGTDRFTFTGVQSSSADLDASRTALGYGASLTAGLKTKNDTFAVTGMFMQETAIPVVIRDGVNPSKLELDDGQVWSVIARWQRNFYP